MSKRGVTGVTAPRRNATKRTDASGYGGILISVMLLSASLLSIGVYTINEFKTDEQLSVTYSIDLSDPENGIGFSYSGTSLVFNAFADSETYRITQSASSSVKTISISSGISVGIVIDGIDISGDISVSASANVELYISGTNTIAGSILVPTGAAITIDDASSLGGSNDGILTITATSGVGNAGIGGSNGQSSGSVTINGGTVTVTGGSYGSGISGAAGIGGGRNASGGDTTINGGTITTTGGPYGAGIGGGDGGAGGNITINGGTVIATGIGMNAPGIGGTSNAGTIMINGGTITAVGGRSYDAFGAAGIGTGQSQSSGTVTIAGGSVTATGGDGAAGIGRGYTGATGTAINVSIASSAQVTAYSSGVRPAIDMAGDNIGGGYYVNAVFNAAISSSASYLQAYAAGDTGTIMVKLELPAGYRGFAFSMSGQADFNIYVNGTDGKRIVQRTSGDVTIYSVNTPNGYASDAGGSNGYLRVDVSSGHAVNEKYIDTTGNTIKTDATYLYDNYTRSPLIAGYVLKGYKWGSAPIDSNDITLGYPSNVTITNETSIWFVYEVSEYIVFDLSDTEAILTGPGAAEWGLYLDHNAVTGTLTIRDPGVAYRITGSDSDVTSIITEGTVTIVFDNIRFEGNISLAQGSVLTLYIDGKNNINGSIVVQTGTTLRIYSVSSGDNSLTVNARSVGNAGIGGDNGRAGGATYIYSGKVTATGNGGGAGIGGGSRGSGGLISIYGGTVTAIGGNEGGAGIGRGSGGTSGATISIGDAAEIRAYSKGPVAAIDASSVSGYYVNVLLDTAVSSSTTLQVYAYPNSNSQPLPVFGDGTGDPMVLELPSGYAGFAFKVSGSAISDRYNILVNDTGSKVISRSSDNSTLIYPVSSLNGYVSHNGTNGALPVSLHDARTVVFDPDNGDPAFTSVAVYGIAMQLPADPVKEEHDFIGWYLGNAVWDPNTPVTTDMTLKAVYSPYEYVTVTFDDGHSSYDVIVRKGTQAERQPTPVSEGYVFIGWYLDGEIWNFNTAVVEDTYLLAKYGDRGDYWAVTFVPNNGEDEWTEFVLKDQQAEEPLSPVLSGFVFLGWQTDTGDIWVFDTQVKNNIILTAKWERDIDLAEVTFVPNNGDASYTIYVLVGTTTDPPADPVRYTYIFTGWTVDGQPWNPYVPITGNTTITATYAYDPTYWAQVTGVIMHSSTGEKLGGVTVVYVTNDTSPLSFVNTFASNEYTVMTDENGVYIIWLLRGSSLTITEVLLEGHKLTDIAGIPSGMTVSDDIVLDIVMSKQLYNLTITGDPGSVIEYTIGGVKGTATIDDTGTFTIQDIPYGDKVEISSHRNGKITSWTHSGYGESVKIDGEALSFTVAGDAQVSLTMVSESISTREILLACTVVIAILLALLFLLSRINPVITGKVTCEDEGVQGARIEYKANEVFKEVTTDRNGVYRISVEKGSGVVMEAPTKEGYHGPDVLNTFSKIKNRKTTVNFKLKRSEDEKEEGDRPNEESKEQKEGDT